MFNFDILFCHKYKADEQNYEYNGNFFFNTFLV